MKIITKMPSKYYSIDKKKVVVGIKHCISNALDLARVAEFIVKKGEDPRIALGVYSFAIEEFGKALMLKDCLGKGKEVCSVPRDIFVGKDSHDLKFKKALSKLPNSCKYFEEKKFVNTPISEDFTLDVGPHDTFYTFDLGTKIYNLGDFPLDFAARMYCFYVDWNNHMKSWKIGPHVSENKLMNSIRKFIQHIGSQEKS